MSFESAQAQYDAMEPPDWDECPVCEDLEECECDHIGTRLLAGLARVDDQLAAMKEEGRRWV
jgi:hypothetical protein|tara:strand:- start:1845 stop:2030 length:186 start_codon:yes stop_codon:yes gene_type:complete